MNDHDIAQMLAVELGKMLSSMRTHAGTLEIENASEFVEESQRILGKEGDLAGHNFLIDSLRRLRPDDAILSEEEDKATLAASTQARLTSNRVWIVDPLDGTAEYSTGREDYAVHVALWDRQSTKKSGIVAACVSVPERGEVWTMTDEVKVVNDDSRPIRIMVSRSRPPLKIEEIINSLDQAFPHRDVELLPMGSVGAKVGWMLAGHADMYINTGGFFEWDLAAPLGVAVHHGFVVCDVQGNPFSLNQENPKLTSAIVCRPEFESLVMKSLA